MYQCSIGSPAAEVFASHQGVKLLDYHNITPANLVERWLPPLGAETRLGREQLSLLASVVDYAIADSPFNAAELVECGYRHAEVVPVLISTGNLIAEPDADLLRRYGSESGNDWLFVGQLAPHKAQHDIIMAFSRYRALFDRGARLHLVGREMGGAYRETLRQFIDALGLRDAVMMPGSVSTSELVSYYELADVFVCLSDHEGFCAPIAEAMSRGLPVVAYRVAAVPDTVGGAGILLDDKSPDLVAAVVHELLAAPEIVAGLKVRGRKQAATFTLERAEQAFQSAMNRAIDLLS
jgi:glycosyltransferase involved in cell wall biosynthesis